MGYEHTPGAVPGAPVAAYFWFGRPLGKEFNDRSHIRLAPAGGSLNGDKWSSTWFRHHVIDMVLVTL